MKQDSVFLHHGWTWQRAWETIFKFIGILGNFECCCTIQSCQWFTTICPNKQNGLVICVSLEHAGLQANTYNRKDPIGHVDLFSTRWGPAIWRCYKTLDTESSIMQICQLLITLFPCKNQLLYFILGAFTMMIQPHVLLTQPQNLAFCSGSSTLKVPLLCLVWSDNLWQTPWLLEICQWHFYCFQSLQRVPACPALNADLTGQNWSRSNVSLNKK